MWICKECSHEWEAVVCNRNVGRGCPECNKSKGEKKIQKVLDLSNAYYTPQKEFNGLIGIGNGLLSYDFYLLKYNLLIEYQGEFHDHVILNYKNEPRELAEARLSKQQEHDKRKKLHAKENNINLLEIWYYDYDNIEKIINDYIKQLENN